jgi:hypothetical protein
MAAAATASDGVSFVLSPKISVEALPAELGGLQTKMTSAGSSRCISVFGRASGSGCCR